MNRSLRLKEVATSFLWEGRGNLRLGIFRISLPWRTLFIHLFFPPHLIGAKFSVVKGWRPFAYCHSVYNLASSVPAIFIALIWTLLCWDLSVGGRFGNKTEVRKEGRKIFPRSNLHLQWIAPPSFQCRSDRVTQKRKGTYLKMKPPAQQCVSLKVLFSEHCLG